jgi:predicted  nucleic acid-binding Zn-ribbon protein
MKSAPSTDPLSDLHGVTKILDKHGARLEVHGGRGISHKQMFEELLGEMEAEKHRTAVVQANLNAILNQYQVTSQSLKALQQRHEEVVAKAQRNLLDATNDDTDTQSK